MAKNGRKTEIKIVLKMITEPYAYGALNKRITTKLAFLEINTLGFVG